MGRLGDSPKKFRPPPKGSPKPDNRRPLADGPLTNNPQPDERTKTSRHQPSHRADFSEGLAIAETPTTEVILGDVNPHIPDADPRSKEAAQREAAEWLDWLVKKGAHNWAHGSPMSISAKPSKHLPCQVLAATAYVENQGHMPYLMLMAGKKHRNRYWQYSTVDLQTGVPHARNKALRDVDHLVDTLITIAAIPPAYPRRRIRTP